MYSLLYGSKPRSDTNTFGKKVLGSLFENILLMKTATDNHNNAESNRYWGTQPRG